MTTTLGKTNPTSEPPKRTEVSSQEASIRTDALLAMLGHEMRNPLSALSNALEIWPLHDAAEMEELRRVMQRQVSQLIHLSEDLNDAARFTHGKIALQRNPVALAPLIQEACEEIQPFIDSRGHFLNIRILAGPIEVLGDRPRLLQVVANLIQNAAKFTDRNGVLSISLEQRDETAVIRVKDNGVGIAKNMQTKIFDAFTQGEGHQGLQGLGIGLMLVKTIVELHGGTVGVCSEGLGQGSEFTVQLPLLCTESKRHFRTRTSHTDSHDRVIRQPPPHRIVVVDDDRTSVELLARMLRSIGQTVTVCANGEETLSVLWTERPQVVFLDIVMRGMNGLELARAIRRRSEWDGLVLIALSGNADDESKRQAMKAGFDTYLVKPTSMAALAELLAKIPVAD